MKKITLFLITLFFTTVCFSQTYDMSKLTKHIVDSTYRPVHFLSLKDAENIIEKPALLKDSACKVTASVLRYTLNYIAVYKDSTSKGRIFFTYEEYKDVATASTIYTSIKTENEKTANFTPLTDTGNEAFLVKDNFNYPFIVIRKENKLFKFKLYYLTTASSTQRLLKVAKQIVSAH